MPYHRSGEMHQLGQEILEAAVKTIRHNNSGSIGAGYETQREVHQLKAEYGDVPQLLVSYGQTDPANCQAAVDELFSVADNIDPTNSVTLNSRAWSSGTDFVGLLPKHTGGWTDALPIAVRARDIDSHLSGWRGAARHQFDTFFVNHIATAFPLQAALTRALALILQAHQEIRARANADVWEIGQKTVAALRAQRGFCSCTPATVTATITVGIAAATVLTGVRP